MSKKKVLDNLAESFRLATRAPDPQTRADAYRHAHTSDRRDLIDLYLDLALKDPSPVVRRMAAKILGDYPEFPHSEDWVRGYLRDLDAGVRCEALSALVRLGVRETDDTLRAQLSVMTQTDPDEEVRRAAAFRLFYADLCAEFPVRYGLPRRLLDTLCDLEKTFTLEQLGEFADSWCALNDRTGLPEDAFQKLVIQGTALLRGAAIYLRRAHKNPQGWTVTRPQLVADSLVQWVPQPEEMDRIIEAA